MPQITPTAVAFVPGVSGPGRGMSRDVLHHLGSLLRDADAPSDHPRFIGLLSRLHAAMANAGTGDAEIRAGLLRFMPNLRRFAVSLTRDEAAAEDVMQDALMRAWRSRATFVLGTNLEAWLLTITRNAFLTSVRTRRREVNDIDGEEAARLTVAPEQGGRADLTDARTALAKMPPFMREALILIAIEDVSYEDAATIMGCRIGTVKSRVWRARQHLAKVLGYDGAEIGSDGLMLAAASTRVRRSLPPQ